MYYLISRWGDVALGITTGLLAFMNQGWPRAVTGFSWHLTSSNLCTERHWRAAIPEDERLLVS